MDCATRYPSKPQTVAPRPLIANRVVLSRLIRRAALPVVLFFVLFLGGRQLTQAVNLDHGFVQTKFFDHGSWI